jgi:hypothetical protein
MQAATSRAASAELGAESVAFILYGLVGVDSAEYSFGYVAGWGGGEDAIRRIRESGHQIQQRAQTVLNDLGLDAEESS